MLTDKNLLDNIGITVKVGELPARKAYLEARRSLYGTGRLSRLWMRWAFPLLRPKEHSRRLDRVIELHTIIQQEFLNAVMERYIG